MRHIDKYFKKSGENMSRLAARIGKPTSSISRPLRGEVWPARETAFAVENATGGAVTALQFIQDCMEAER